MEGVRILITYGENCEGNKYHRGNIEMIFAPKNMTIDALLVMVNEIVGVDLNKFVYKLRSLFKTDGKVTRLNIKNDRDLHYV